MEVVNSLSSVRGRYQASTAIAIITASVFGMAGAVQAAEVRHQQDEWLKPTGKGWGELDPSGETARNALKFGNRTNNGIFYHGGPVMLGTANIYYIWYGNWSGNTATGILEDLAKNLGGSPWENINTTYSDLEGRVSGFLNFVKSVNDNYSQGTNLSDAQVQAVVASAISTGSLPADDNGVYFVLTSADVNATSGFCRAYCGWHTHGTIGGKDIKYSFVGNPDRCPAACSEQTTSPNGNAGADGMANIIAHEQVEAVSDPDLNAWYDRRGQENADKCAWTFGMTYKAPNGSLANMRLGMRNYLIQQNWVNASGGFCATHYP